MSNIKLTLENTKIKKEDLIKYNKKVTKAHEELHTKSENKNEFVGWLNLPTNYNKEEFEKIKKCAEKIKKDSEIFLVIGIGGSYLGARAVIEALTSSFYNKESENKRTEVLYVGNNMSTRYINDLLEYIGNKEISINVISKSGTTTEPAIAFRLFR